MISPSSLSAFSASVAGPNVAGRVQGAGPIQQASAQPARAQQAAPPGAGNGQLSRPLPDAAPGRTLPRGSLLDLSV